MGISVHHMIGFSEMIEKAAELTPEQIGGIAAIPAGALSGYLAHKSTRDPSKKMRNALIASLLGAGVGYGGVKKLVSGDEPETPTKTLFDRAKEVPGDLLGVARGARL